ncbi:MAG: hypothetical protein Q9162_003270 [Coniocarpon cinnabarinum]
MDNLGPTGPPQPPLDQSYQVAGNPAQKEPAEQLAAHANANAPSSGEHRVPTQQSAGFADATPSSLGYGVHGAPPGEEARGLTEEDVGKHQEFEGEQMRAPGEKDTYNVVQQKPGASGSAPDLASDLDRKKAEQAPLREAVTHERERKVDVAGVLSNRGGPANPVDKNNYPNSGV